MSIKKTIPNNIGVPAENWKATSVTIDYLNMKAQSTCLGYVNQEAMNNPEARHIDSDTITIQFFWNEEALNQTKPVKPEGMSDEDYEKLIEAWRNEANRQVVNDELWQAFQVLLKYQYIFHTKGQKLKDGTLLLDTKRQ